MAQLEKRGIPSVCLCADSFVPLADAYAKSIGYPARVVVFEMPIAGNSSDEIREKGETMADAVLEALAGNGSATGS